MTTFRGFQITGSMQSVLEDWREVSTKITVRAERDALNRTANSVSGLIIRRTAKALGVKQEAIRGSKKKGTPRRIYVRRVSARHPRAFVDVLTLPVSIQSAGGIVPIGKLVSSKGKPLEGVFRATMKSGHTSFFARRNKARLPIDEGRLGLSPYIETVAQVAISVDGPRLFAQHFNSRMKYHLGRNPARTRGR